VLYGATGVAYMIAVVRRTRRVTEYKPVFEDWLFHAALPLAAYFAVFVAAIGLRRAGTLSLFAIGAATVAAVRRRSQRVGHRDPILVSQVGRVAAGREVRAMTPAKSDHFDGKAFRQPDRRGGPAVFRRPRMLLTQRTPWPAQVDGPTRTPVPSMAPRRGGLHRPRDVSDSDRSGNILTDPMFAGRVRSMDRPTPGAAARCAFRRPSAHRDGAPRPQPLRPLRSADAGVLAKRFDPIVVTPEGNGRVARSAGMRRVEELDWWQSATTSAMPVTLTPRITSPRADRSTRTAPCGVGF
jgi:hypothetical protein